MKQCILSTIMAYLNVIPAKFTVTILKYLWHSEQHSVNVLHLTVQLYSIPIRFLQSIYLFHSANSRHRYTTTGKDQRKGNKQTKQNELETKRNTCTETESAQESSSSKIQNGKTKIKINPNKSSKHVHKHMKHIKVKKMWRERIVSRENPHNNSNSNLSESQRSLSNCVYGWMFTLNCRERESQFQKYLLELSLVLFMPAIMQHKHFCTRQIFVLAVLLYR